MNILDILLIAAVAVALGLAARKVVSDRRQGRTSCGGDCAHCMQNCRERSDPR